MNCFLDSASKDPCSLASVLSKFELPFNPLVTKVDSPMISPTVHNDTRDHFNHNYLNLGAFHFWLDCIYLPLRQCFLSKACNSTLDSAYANWPPVLSDNHISLLIDAGYS